MTTRGKSSGSSNPFELAMRHKLKLRASLVGPSGSGKTWTALLIAEKMIELITGKPVQEHDPTEPLIAFIDTEGRSARKYAGRFTFHVVDLSKNYNPRRYIEAMQAAAKHGYKVLVIDSLSHAWTGVGGTLDVVDKAGDKKGGNKWAGWSEGRPLQNAFHEAIINTDVHIIGTMRSKTDWVLETDERGKTKPVKVGMAPIQSDDLEYEFDVSFLMGMDHTLTVSKSRCDNLDEGEEYPPDDTDRIAAIMHDWLNEGTTSIPQPRAANTWLATDDDKEWLRNFLKQNDLYGDNGEKAADLLKQIDSEASGFGDLRITREEFLNRVDEIKPQFIYNDWWLDPEKKAEAASMLRINGFTSEKDDEAAFKIAADILGLNNWQDIGQKFTGSVDLKVHLDIASKKQKLATLMREKGWKKSKSDDRAVTQAAKALGYEHANELLRRGSPSIETIEEKLRTVYGAADSWWTPENRGLLAGYIRKQGWSEADTTNEILQDAADILGLSDYQSLANFDSGKAVTDALLAATAELESTAETDDTDDEKVIPYPGPATETATAEALEETASDDDVPPVTWTKDDARKYEDWLSRNFNIGIDEAMKRGVIDDLTLFDGIADAREKTIKYATENQWSVAVTDGKYTNSNYISFSSPVGVIRWYSRSELAEAAPEWARFTNVTEWQPDDEQLFQEEPLLLHWEDKGNYRVATSVEQLGEGIPF